MAVDYESDVADGPAELIKTYFEISQSAPRLVQELRPMHLPTLLSICGGLLLVPANQTRAARIESLVFLALMHACGENRPTVADLDRWLNVLLRDNDVARIEDPPEDVVVGNVTTSQGNFRTFNGDWSNPDCYLQDVIDVLNTAPAALEHLREFCVAALGLSDVLASDSGLPRYALLQGVGDKSVWLPDTDRDLYQLGRGVFFDEARVRQLGILPSPLRPICTTIEQLKLHCAEDRPQQLRKWPIVQLGNELIVLFGTAIPMAIIDHVLQTLSAAGQMRGFAAHLWKLQGERTVNAAGSHILQKDDLTSELPDTPLSKRLMSAVGLRFDVSKRLHLVFFHDDPFDMAKRGLMARAEPDAGAAMSEYLERSAFQLAEESEYTGGLTLLVVGGLGRSYFIPTPKRLPDNWGLQVWSSPDVDRLMLFEERWRLLLWKLSAHVAQLRTLGIKMPITHSDANLYAMWSSNGYRLLPHGLEAPPPFDFFIGPEHIHKLRVQTRLGIDRHSIRRPDRDSWEQVMKLHFRSYFDEDARGPSVYASERAVLEGRLEGAVETARRAWWVDCHTPPENPEQRDLAYRIWESTCNWMLRLAPVLDRQLINLPETNFIIDLDLTALATDCDWSLEHIAGLAPLDEIPIALQSHGVHLIVPFEIVSELNKPANKGERLVIEAIVTGIVKFAGGGSEMKDAIIRDLDIKDDERFVHLFAVHAGRDFLGQYDHAPAEPVREEDLSVAGMQLANEAGLSVPSKITGSSACNEALHAVVDACWARIRTRLEQLSRRDVVLGNIYNHERLLLESERWARTSRAVIATHREKADAVRSSRRVKEQRDLSQIATRILVEMAVCVAPTSGGRAMTQADADYVRAQIVVLIGAASRSDAVRAGCLDPVIDVGFLGNFTTGTELMETMQTYLGAYFEQMHAKDVLRYEEFYRPPVDGSKTDVEVFGRPFVDAFKAEYGVAPMTLARLGVEMAENAASAQRMVMVLPHPEFRELLASCELTAEEIDSIYRHFIFHPRPDWSQVPKPFRNKDWWPWRFRRRLSMMVRPIVSIGEEGVIFAPAFCEDSFRHVVMEAFTGAAETEYFHSRAMKQWVGRNNAERGLQFNKAVANQLVKLGYEVAIEVDINRIGALRSDATGDIDVLAWKGSDALICECKELNFARTLGEVSEQLSRFRGIENDDLAKHLHRVEWVSTNMQALSSITKVPITSIRSLLITSKTVPMQFAVGLPTEIFTIEELADRKLAARV